MKEIAIKVLYTILGLNASSGIVYSDDIIYAISDQSNALYEYNTKTNETIYHSLDGNEINHAITKEEKYDLEAIVKDENTLFMVGSGSKSNRNLSFLFDTQLQIADTLSLDYLYETTAEFSEIPLNEFNIEGVVKYKDDFIFMNRGNGKSNINALMVVQGKNLVDEFNTFTYTFNLPKINNVPTGFSDGIVIKDQLFFLATAESSTSTYSDGNIGGTLLGAIDLKKMKLKFTKVISNNQKFEGIALKSINGKNVEFLLCEDNDMDNETSSNIYLLTAKLNSKP